LVLLSGFVELPPIEVLSEEYIEAVDTAFAAFAGTAISVAVGSTVPMALMGHMSFFWGLFDII